MARRPHVDGAGVGDGVEQIEFSPPGRKIRIAGHEIYVFAVNPPLAVAGQKCVEVRGDHAAIFEGASPIDVVAARKGLAGVGKNFNAVDTDAGAAIRAAEWLIGFLRDESAGKKKGRR